MKKKENVLKKEDVHESCSCDEKCKCRSNKKYYLKVFIVSFVGVFLFLGGLITGAVLLYKNDNAISDKCVIVDDNDSKVEIELFTREDLPYKDISLNTEDDILAFVNSLSFSSEEARKEFFSNEGEYDFLPNLNEFKVSYVLYKMFGHMSEYMDPVFISEDLIIEEMNKLFVLEDNYFLPDVNDFSFGGLHHFLKCADKICIANVGMGGTGVGNPFYETKIVSLRKEGTDTVYILDDYYYSSKFDKESDSFTYSEKKVGTYEMTFDKDNRYVGSKKIK